MEIYSPFFEIHSPFDRNQDQKNGLGMNLIAHFSGCIARFTAVNSRFFTLTISI